jgi:hypothetical protein
MKVMLRLTIAMLLLVAGVGRRCFANRNVNVLPRHVSETKTASLQRHAQDAACALSRISHCASSAIPANGDRNKHFHWSTQILRRVLQCDERMARGWNATVANPSFRADGILGQGALNKGALL